MCQRSDECRTGIPEPRQERLAVTVGALHRRDVHDQPFASNDGCGGGPRLLQVRSNGLIQVTDNLETELLPGIVLVVSHSLSSDMHDGCQAGFRYS